MNLVPLPRMSEYLLEDFMMPLGLTLRDVSDGAGIAEDEMTEILRDEQEITPELSEKLGTFFGISPMLFFNIQEELKERSGVRELQYA